MAPLSGLLDVLYPPACVGCGKVLPGQAFFCEGCDAEVERTPPSRCARCSEPGAFPGGVCPRCVARPPNFGSAFAPFAHGGPVAKAIHRFKYEDRPELARPLAALLAAEAMAFLAEATGAALCAIPLHEKRFRERRYDQAQLLCGELARRLKREVLPEALERVRETSRQVGRTDEEREQNVQGAFCARAELGGRRLLLVDDVFTTGATARAAAGALLARGAAEVKVLTLARANLLG
ncbi:MAG: ComF family protein [Myxococcaceae bacterium]